MKIAYQNENVTLWHGDCREWSGKADAVVSDPPYGAWLARNNGKRGRLLRSESLGASNHTSAAGIAGRVCAPIHGDGEAFDPAPWIAFPECWLWGANWFAGKIPDGGAWHIWDKRCGIASNNFGDAEIAWCSNYSPTRICRLVWNGMIKGERGALEHPTQKPVKVMKWALEFVTGATVLDPYAGSGTTLIAALETGRKAIGIEIDERWVEVARRRLERWHAQGRLDFGTANDKFTGKPVTGE